MGTACWPMFCQCVRALTRQWTVPALDRFFDMVDWERMLHHDYKPPMVPSLAHDLDLSFFDPTFTSEPPYVLCTHLGSIWSQYCAHSQLRLGSAVSSLFGLLSG